MRFKDFEYDAVPGPGLYKLKGFADETVEHATKFNSIVDNCPYAKQESDGYQSNEMAGGINVIEENENEL